jgi:hypothetical protein
MFEAFIFWQTTMTTYTLSNGEKIHCQDIDHLIFNEKNKLYSVVLKSGITQTCSRDELWDISQECPDVVSKIYQP